MAPVVVDPARIYPFNDAAAFEVWLAENHGRAPEVWIPIAKKGSGVASVTPAEAIDLCLCWGWIDAIRKSGDERVFLQRFTPRRPRSVWSRVNVENVERLLAAGRMTEHGMRHVEAARADGRWARAYRIKDAEVPDDLSAAIRNDPRARDTFASLSAQNRFAIIYRVGATRTEAGRRKAIERMVAMLAEGRTIHPQRVPAAGSRAPYPP